MKLLILGGTKFLGRHLVEAALQVGHEVTLFNRGQHDPAAFPEVETLIGDRRHNLKPLKTGRWDAVIDTCGYVPSAVRASAQLLADRTDTYIFISSQSAYLDFKIPNVDESYPTEPLTEAQLAEAEALDPQGSGAVNYGRAYGGLKALCEQAAEQEMPGRVMSVRAGLIVGPHDYTDRFTYWVRRVSAGGEALAPGEPTRPVQLIGVRDLSDWLVLSAEARLSGIFNATGPAKRLSMEEMLNACRTATSSNARFTWVGEPFLKVEAVEAWSELPFWMPAEKDADNFFSMNCTKAIGGGLTFSMLTDTVRATLEWDRIRGTPPLHAGLTAERERELLEKWRAAS